MLIGVLENAFYGLGNHDQVVELGERRVLGARTGHIDDTFLETDDLTGGHDSHASENMGLTGTNGVDLGDDAGENAAGALYLDTGFDNVLDGGDPNALPGFGNVEADGLETSLYIIVLVNE